MARSQTENSTVEYRLLELAKIHPDGISNDSVKKDLSDVPLTEITVVINKFLKNG